MKNYSTFTIHTRDKYSTTPKENKHADDIAAETIRQKIKDIRHKRELEQCLYDPWDS